MIGQLLDRRYEMTQVLAAGGFGQTYLARDTRRPGHPVCVVKQLRSPTNDPQALSTIHRLFNTEAETLEKLGKHDQIPQLLAHFEENKEFYLVQEFIPGHPLTNELIPGRVGSEEQLINLLTGLLEILVFVHRQGVIHRDIKPANIIRRKPDGKLVLIDFGAVKELTSIRTQQQPNPTVGVGTPAYMPIEQFQGYPQFNSDIYAVGVIGIQVATGLSVDELVSLLGSPNSTLGKKSWRDRCSIRAELANILDQMIQPDYRNRYQSAQAVLDDLNRLVLTQTAPLPPTLINPVVATQPTQAGVSGIATNPNSLTLISNSNKPNSKPIRGLLMWVGGGLAVVVLGLGVTLWNYRPQLLVHSGSQDAKSGNYQEAEQKFTQAIELNPNLAEAYLKRGAVRSRSGNYPGAEADATKALEINPNSSEAYAIRGDIRLLLKKHSQALDDFNKAINLNPSYAEAYISRGLVRYNLKDYKGAIADQSQVLQLKPKEIRAYVNRALARSEIGDLSGALNDLDDAIKITPDNADAYNNRGLLRLKQGDKDEALQDLNKAIEIAPKNGQFYLSRASIYDKLGNQKALIEDLRLASKFCLQQNITGCYNDAQYWLKRLE